MVALPKNQSSMNKEPIVIVGAGWSGLAAAVNLTSKGQTVHIYEAAKQTGGRARAVKFDQHTVDNGQHLLIGAYTSCLELMELVGIDTSKVLKRLPLLLTVIDRSDTQLKLSAPALPAPLHLLYALLTAQGITLKQRFAAIRFGLHLKFKHYHYPHDISVAALLNKTGQPDILIRQLWEPLCLATMNTPISEASANIFMRVFKDAFTRKTQDADLLLPIVDLSKLFPDAAINYIEQHGGKVFLQSRIEKIELKENNVHSVSIKKSSKEIHNLKTSHIILATAPQNILKLISTQPLLENISSQIKQYQYEPIVTVYLQYAKNIKLSQDMLGLSSTVSQWVFDRGQVCQQDGLMSVVISSRNEKAVDHMKMDDVTLSQTVHNEIKPFLDHHNPLLLNSFVVREKRATFAAKVNFNTIRPQNTTAINGLMIAGDYTDTGYPATLEGAVRSGLSASSKMLDTLNQ